MKLIRVISPTGSVLSSNPPPPTRFLIHSFSRLSNLISTLLFFGSTHFFCFDRPRGKTNTTQKLGKREIGASWCPSASPFSSLFLCKKSSSSWDANYLGPAKTVRITDITFQLEGNGIERSFEQVQSRLSSDVVLHTDFISDSDQKLLLNQIYTTPVSKWKSLKNRRLQN
ncbi:unnamed protein product [Lactuca saligna]|uniref:Uncharacterized protein n=1 Tax=Lactuca saligna TaxID=75948 RepID=A0AA36EJA6_LACSI|nr:unnamed protein product [Lactuca saligna]